MSNVGAPVRSRGPVVALRTLKERARPDRRAWTLPELDVPFVSLLDIALPTFEPDQCPLCAQGLPVTKPGSRPLAT